MQSDTAQQVVALLQAAGVLTPEAAEHALMQGQRTEGNLLQTLRSEERRVGKECRL